jgi:DNA-binding NtrC family response regulator
MVRRWIEREGVDVTEAESAEQALLLASQEPPKVAFCDVNLPRGQNGFWLAAELRRLYPATVVIMTTGNHQFEAAVAGLRAGVSEYLVKPFPPERLRQALATALAEHRARLSSEAPWRPAESVREARRISTRFAALDAVVSSENPAKADHARRVARVAAGIASSRRRRCCARWSGRMSTASRRRCRFSPALKRSPLPRAKSSMGPGFPAA